MGNNTLPYEIVHCSSWDEDYDPEQLVKSSPGNQLEPLPIKCRGWQTPKCPEYPQDLIIHVLSGSSRISKLQILSHHFKIATKIDIYMGTLKDPQDVLDDIIPDTPPNDNEDNMLIEFKRLGHVCFDNNARAQFRARELKSIKINSDGEYIRLVVRNCHRNRLNEYNQVGILALNLLGQPLHLLDKNDITSTSSSSIPQMVSRHPFDDNSILSSSTRRTSVSSNQSQINKIPTSSVFEIELQHWIQALLNAEEEAVQNESYQIAKTYKYISDKLERFTKILSDLEIGKRHAVETKDYDEAEKIKDDIKEIRQAAEIMLKQANIHITEDGRIIPIESTETLLEDEEEEEEEEFKPMTKVDVPPEQEEEHIPTDPDTIPEPIMEEERIPYTLPIQLFGEEIVACVLSIKAKCRTRGLEHIQQQIDTYQQLLQNNQLEDFAFTILDKTQLDEDDEEEEELEEVTKAVSLYVNATLMMVQEAVMDSRELIVISAIDTWAQLNTLVQTTKVHPRWIMEWTRRTFSGLLKRTGDSNAKIKSAATALVLVLVQDYALMSLYIAKPDRVIHQHKEAKARIELVEVTVLKFGIQADKKKSSGQVDLQDLMAFVVTYLNHAHDDVRQAAVKLVVTISDLIGFNLVSTFIDEKLRISLTETVKKLVDKDPYYYYNKDKSKNPTKETISEIRALTVAKPEKKSNVSSKSVKKTTSQKSVKSTSEKKTASKSTASKATVSKSNTKKPARQQKPKEEPVVIDENSICIFCDEVNPDFNEDTLIKHYYNNCPVLTNCPMCQIITEISTLNDHMLVDCDKRHLIKECNRCHKAIPVEQWLQHTLKQVCQDTSNSDKVFCPLCSTSIEPPNDAGWKSHLLTGEGCPNLKKSRKPKQAKKMKRVV